jgi:hypothetical protein
VRAKGASLKATEQPIDTATAAGKCFLNMLGVFAEFETNLRLERQLEGIAKAKAAGVYKGRPASIDVTKVRQLKAQGMGASEIAKALKIGRASVYRRSERECRGRGRRRRGATPRSDMVEFRMAVDAATWVRNADVSAPIRHMLDGFFDTPTYPGLEADDLPCPWGWRQSAAPGYVLAYRFDAAAFAAGGKASSPKILGMGADSGRHDARAEVHRDGPRHDVRGL